jgi:ABC-type amino acid transport system permease subunit
MTTPNVLVQLMLAVLFTHELDAMAQSEWRLLYVLRDLSDEQGRWWFVAMHVPLFWALIALTQHESARVQRASRTGLAAFLHHSCAAALALGQ